MKEYVAIHYIPTPKGLKCPGEIVSDLPEEAIPRLLEKGAIEEIAPVSAAEEEKPVKAEKAPKAKKNVEPEMPEIEAEEEAPEIDALDGICDAEPEPVKPAKKTRKSTKKEG